MSIYKLNKHLDCSCFPQLYVNALSCRGKEQSEAVERRNIYDC